MSYKVRPMMITKYVLFSFTYMLGRESMLLLVIHIPFKVSGGICYLHVSQICITILRQFLVNIFFKKFMCVCVCLSVLACLYVLNVHTVPMESRRGYISPGTGVNSQL